MATGSHGTQPGPLWRGGDRRVTGARSERETAKPERQGQDMLSTRVPSGVRRWWRASGNSAVTVKIPREKLCPGRPPDIALPTCPRRVDSASQRSAQSRQQLIPYLSAQLLDTPPNSPPCLHPGSPHRTFPTQPPG